MKIFRKKKIIFNRLSEMIPNEELKSIKFLITFSKFFRSTPYNWNPVSDQLFIVSRKQEKFIFWCNAIHAFAFSFYLLVQLILEVNKNVLDYPSVLFLMSWLSYFTWVSNSFYNSFTHKDDYVKFVEELFKIHLYFICKFL